MVVSKIYVLREVTDWNELKKGDLFFNTNQSDCLQEALTDGEDKPDTKELGTITSLCMQLNGTYAQEAISKLLEP